MKLIPFFILFAVMARAESFVEFHNSERACTLSCEIYLNGSSTAALTVMLAPGQTRRVKFADDETTMALYPVLSDESGSYAAPSPIDAPLANGGRYRVDAYLLGAGFSPVAAVRVEPLRAVDGDEIPHSVSSWAFALGLTTGVLLAIWAWFRNAFNESLG